MTQFDDTYGVDKMEELRRKEEAHLIESLSAQYGLPYVNLRGITINPDAILTIEEETARDARCVAFELQNKKLSVAIRNPNNQKTKAVLVDLEHKGYTLNIVMTSTESLEHAWERYKDRKDTAAVKKGVLDIDPDAIVTLMDKLTSVEEVTAAILDVRTLNSARRVSETLEAMFAGALSLGASDIHIEPEEHGIRLRYRLDGVLHDIIDLERSIYERLISRLKLLSGLVLNIRDEAQDGRFTFDIGEKKVEVRSSVIPGASGESMVMRLLDPTVATFAMENLGLNPRMLEVMMEELQKPNGMIITTGPTGSGKTTALYAFLQKKHTPDIKIITIENPVEYKLDDIVQTQTSDDYTFSKGLRSILRQDPDVIMVGEIRDREVAETAVHAAQTGHLVFSTLHTNSAVGAFPRLIDLGVDPRIIGSTFNIILGQRLVRKLCTHCKESRTPTAEEKEVIRNVLSGHPNPPTFSDDTLIYEAKGCEACNNTGFTGRRSIMEAIRVDDAVEEAVINDPREHIIMEAARPQAIPTMVEDGMEKVIEGITSLEELSRVVDLYKTRGKGAEPEAETETGSLADSFEPDSLESDDEFFKHIV